MKVGALTVLHPFHDMYEPHASHSTLPSGQASREREREQWRLEQMYETTMTPFAETT